MRMHQDEIAVDCALVQRLISEQYPEWAHLSVRSVASAGTDNAIYRLGELYAVRLPRIHWARNQIEKESTWLARLAPRLSLTLPVVLERGRPGCGYPYEWAVYSWLVGETMTFRSFSQMSDPLQTASGLATFIKALHRIDITDGPYALQYNLRGVPLKLRDQQTRDSIKALPEFIDRNLVTEVWESALAIPEWHRPPVWFHGDMLSGNLLFQEGRLTAVIDFAGLGVGDPACDLIIAWNLLFGESRRRFRQALDLDEATWLRGRGHALSQAVIFIPYYLKTNPIGVKNALHQLHQVLDDFRNNG